ncbi:MAG: STAS domain-containing protein [archaeon]|nr:STAS domain-containing protein [archaeon]
MQIETRKEGDTTTIIPQGDIDYATAPELDVVVEREAASSEMLVIDMSKVDYISSAGLRSILNADELMENKKGIRLTNVNPNVKSIFDMTNFTGMLNIE